ncbi:MAG: ATP synthase subunit I [Thermodesulfobacteriota bacterium]
MKEKRITPTNDAIEQRLLSFINRANWILLVAIAAGGLVMDNAGVAGGLICGGLIATVNFHLLHRTLKKAFGSGRLSFRGLVMAKYYMRFTVSGLILFVLISKHLVDPLALFAGLSVVIASIFLATLSELKKLIFKEAV